MSSPESKEGMITSRKTLYQKQGILNKEREFQRGRLQNKQQLWTFPNLFASEHLACNWLL